MRTSACVAAVACVLCAAPAFAAPPGAVAADDADFAFIAATSKRDQIAASPRQRAAVAATTYKIHPTLRQSADVLRRRGRAAARASVPLVEPTANDRYAVEVRVSAMDAAVIAQLTAAGLTIHDFSAEWLRVTGEIDAEKLDALAALDVVERVRPFVPPRCRAGAVTSQGRAATNTDDAQTNFGVTGDGVRIGVLSDSCAVLSGGVSGGATNGKLISGGVIIGTSSQSSGDMPAIVENVQDIDPGGSLGGAATDEGRGMIELVHDLAPDADIAFATAFGSEAGFAQNIVALADAGCHVICDDVIYFTEPMFQDGIIAQAVDTVVNDNNVVYFSSAGNMADDSYEANYADSSPTDTVDGPPADFDDFHDFDPGAGVDSTLSVTIAGGGYVYVILQWAEPFAGALGSGAVNDFDLYVYTADESTLLLGYSSTNDSIGDDPYELSVIDNTGSITPFTVAIGIDHYAGPGNDVRLKLVFIGSGFTINEHQTHSPTVFGHAAAAGARAVAAEFYGEVGNGNAALPLGVENVESFSSMGPTTIYFGPTGAALGTPEVRAKPEITAPDGANTTFFGGDIAYDLDTYPNFFGTSAAAPHAAAVAALIVGYLHDHGETNIPPSSIHNLIESNAVDIESAGFDFDSGFGRVDAQAAMEDVGIPGDLDGDGDVDMTDFSTFSTCYAGPDTAPPGGCDDSDFDADGDVDLADFATFQRNYTG